MLCVLLVSLSSQVFVEPVVELNCEEVNEYSSKQSFDLNVKTGLDGDLIEGADKWERDLVFGL